MVPGLTLALGTTQFAAVADVWLLTYTVFLTARAWPDWRRGFQTHPLVLALAGIIGVTALWSPDPLAAVFAAGRIILLFSLVRTFRPTGQYWLLAAPVLAVQAGFMGYQFLDHPRPHGMSWTASSAGQAGLVYAIGPLGPLAAVTLGLSGARSAALGLIVLTFMSRSKRLWVMAILAGVVFIGVAMINDARGDKVEGVSRVSVAGVSKGIEDRIEITTGHKGATPYVQGLCGDVKPYSWQPWGFGYHGYCLTTGLAKPHNLWVLSWWELGVLAVPFWAIVFYGAWKVRSPMVWALLVVGLITEELFSRPEGYYFVAIGVMGMMHARPAADLSLRRLFRRQPVRPPVPAG